MTDESAAAHVWRGPRKPRILFVCNSLAGGGAERIFTRLIAESAGRRERYDIDVALLDEDPQAYDVPGWARVFRLDCRHSPVLSAARLCALAASLRPDLMVSFLTRANVAAAIAMTMLRRPVVVSERLNTSAQLAETSIPPLSRAIVRLAYPRAAHLIAVSKGVADTLSADYRVPEARLTVINNPVDAERIRALAADEPKCPVGPDDLVAMGRLCPQKNFPLALRAFAGSRWTGRLIVLGTGPLADELRKLGAELGIEDRLLFPGFVSNPYAVVSRAGLFMLTSDYEGFCNSIIEAMALGVPIVATDCPFSPAEILDVTDPPDAGQVASGAGGLLVGRGDEDALVAALDLLTEKAERERLGLEGQRRVRAFDSRSTFDRYWEVIERVLADRVAVRPAAAGDRAPADLSVQH